MTQLKDRELGCHSMDDMQPFAVSVPEDVLPCCGIEASPPILTQYVGSLLTLMLEHARESKYWRSFANLITLVTQIALAMRTDYSTNDTHSLATCSEDDYKLSFFSLLS